METTINLQQLLTKIDKLADAIRGTSSITNRGSTDGQYIRPSTMQGITSIGKIGSVSGLAKATGLTSSVLASDNSVNSTDLSEKELESQQVTKEIAKNFEFLPTLHADMNQVKAELKAGLESVKKAIEDNANPGLLEGLGSLITGLFAGITASGVASTIGNVASKSAGAVKSIAKGIGSVATSPWAVGAAAMLYSPELNQGENAATDEAFYNKLQKNKSKSIPESEWAGAFADGGTIPEGKVGVVGEAGPELVEGYAKITNAEEYAKILKENGDKMSKQLEDLKAERYVVEKLMSPEGIDGKHLTDLSEEDQKKAQEIYTGHGQKIYQLEQVLNSDSYKEMMSPEGLKMYSENFAVAKKLEASGGDLDKANLTDSEKASVAKLAQRGKDHKELQRLEKTNADLGYKDTSVRLGKKNADSADKLLTSSSETDMAKNASSKGKTSQNIVNAPTTINKQTTQNNITPNFKDNDSTIKDYYRSRYSS